MENGEDKKLGRPFAAPLTKRSVTISATVTPSELAIFQAFADDMGMNRSEAAHYLLVDVAESWTFSEDDRWILTEMMREGEINERRE